MGSEINPRAIYDRTQAAELLGIGDTVLRDLVTSGHLRRMRHTRHWRFLGEELLRFAREASGLSEGGVS